MYHVKTYIFKVYNDALRLMNINRTVYNGCRIYVDIMIGEKFWLLIWSVNSSSRREGDGIKGVERGNVNFGMLPVSIY